MNPRERFLKTLNFEKPADRLPMVEWAAWWDKTIVRWKSEGLPENISLNGSFEYFGLDRMLWMRTLSISPECPKPAAHGGSIITDESDYERIRTYILTDSAIEDLKKSALEVKESHEKGEVIIRLQLHGFFWFPRILFGIENHFYAFYDYPDLMHRMNGDLADFIIRAVDELCKVLKPDMIGFGEDMSYNHGPMLSYNQFKEFILPYYQKVVPHIKKYGIKTLMDSDGDITTMIPWIMETGVEGVYPLERQAGVDIVKIRREYPEFLMMGGYDKMVMSLGEEEMRAEFERLLPVMKSGGYIPSVDHQTPPGVSLDNYKIYMRLFREYAQKAVRED